MSPIFFTDLYPDVQAGFRKGRGTTDQIAYTTALVIKMIDL